MTTRSHRPLMPLLLMSLSLLAWLTLGIWGYSPYSRFLTHEDLHPADFRSIRSILMILTGWLVTIVAMMLPTSLPFLERFARITRRQPNHAGPAGLLIAGYLLIWTLFGGVAVFVDSLVHEALDQWLWFAQNDWPIGASLFGLAGVYQFTPPKSYCLDKCRSPTRVLTAYSHHRNGRDPAFRLGMRHGLFSLGCCWPLMLLMFAIGMMNLGWLLVVGTVIAIEQHVSWGRRFRAPLGALLLCCGLAIVLEATLLNN